jgi:ribonuclease PH
LSAAEAKAHENAVLPHDLAAISVGLIDGGVYTDLDYILDSNADVDMNVVMTADGKFVEVQGTGEEFTYTRAELDALLESATAGVATLNEMQIRVLDGVE